MLNLENPVETQNPAPVPLYRSRNTPKTSAKEFITHKGALLFLNSLFVSIIYTVFSRSNAFSKLKKLLVIGGLTLLASGHANAAGDAAAGEGKSTVCSACHGTEGISSISINPNLAGQVPGYIAAQLKAFKSGERVNAIMAGQAGILSDEDMADLDAYFSALPAKATTAMTQEDKLLAEAGRAIYRGGFAERGISACMSCHGPSGHGIPKNFPRVSAQHKEYLEQQLLAYKKGERKGYNEIMWNIAFGLSELQIKQLSAYMSGLR